MPCRLRESSDTQDDIGSAMKKLDKEVCYKPTCSRRNRYSSQGKAHISYQKDSRLHCCKDCESHDRDATAAAAGLEAIRKHWWIVRQHLRGNEEVPPGFRLRIARMTDAPAQVIFCTLKMWLSCYTTEAWNVKWKKCIVPTKHEIEQPAFLIAIKPQDSVVDNNESRKAS